MKKVYKVIDAVFYVLNFVVLVAFIFTFSFFEDILRISHKEFFILSLILLPPILILNTIRISLQEQFKKQTEREINSQRIFTEEDRTINTEEIKLDLKALEIERLLKHLGIDKSYKEVSIEDIKKEYKRLAKIWHPDFGRNEIEIKIRTEKMAELNSVFEKLESLI